MTTQAQLSQVRPDFEDLRAQLQAAVLTMSSWQDMLVTSTGQTLVDLLAAIGAYDQYAIESALQEVFPSTAKNASSLYATAQMLGVRLSRKLPAVVTVSMSSTTPLSIPAYTQFTGAGSFFFNREVLNLTSTPQDVELHQGKVVAFNLNGLGSAFQAYVCPEDAFSVSDQDTYVWLNSVPVTRITSGLWEGKGVSAFQDITMPDGRASFMFGNSIYGAQPGVNDVIGILYVVTSGADGNNLETLDKRLAVDGVPNIDAVAIENPHGGANEPSPILYKSVAAPLFGSFESATTDAQYRNLPLTYPGVLDAHVFSQRDMNPRATAWMKLHRCVLLTSSVWSQPDKDAFIEWYQARTLSGSRYYLEDPLANPINMNLTLYCGNTSTLAQAVEDARAAVENLFVLRPGVLGRDLYLSDIVDAVLDSNTDIKYMTNSLTADVHIARTNVSAPQVSFSAAAGSLIPGLYDYSISYTSTFGGETAPAKWTTMLLSAPDDTATLTWQAVPNVVNYKVWGRTSAGTLGLLATVSANTLSWIDDGSVTPVAPVVPQDTTPVVYNTLGTLNISAQYATRR